MALCTSKENTNFARICRILVDVGASALRNVFDGIYNPVLLHSALCTHFAKLDKLKKRGILSDLQWNLLFPAPPACVTSSKFDVTLLAVLLRSICGLSAPAKGWNDLPPSTDTNIQDDIARIKYYRNKVVHASKASMTDVDFTDVWTAVEGALLRLGAKAEHINNLKCSSMDPEAAERCVRALKQWFLQEQNVEEIRKLNRRFKTVKEDVTRIMKRTHERVEEVAQEVSKMSDTLDKVREDQQVKRKTQEVTTTLEIKAGLKDSTANSSDSLEEQFHPQVKSLLHKLREEYKKREAFVHPVPWCEDFQLSLETIYTEVRIVSRKKERSKLTRRLWGLYEIFKPHEDCDNPRVVFLEGKPGIGKTVSCQKVTYDWSTGKLSGFLADFEILLKIKCRDIRSSDIKEAIADQLLPQDLLPEVKIAFFDHIQKSQPQVLLVLDGLDELKEGIDLSSLIIGRVLPDCHLVLTSRGNPDLRQHCDTLFQIIGFTPEHASNFIRQYFGGNEAKAKVLLDKIPPPRRTGREAVGASRMEKCADPADNKELESDENGQTIEDGEHKEDWPETDDGGVLRELISNPLNTALLCAVVDDTNGKLPSTATMLYQEMAFCVLARHYKKNGQNPPPDPMTTHKEDLDALGRLAQKGIKNDRLHFNEDDFCAEGCGRNILDFGFLSKETSASRIRPRFSYQFLHRTFQEFFSAFHLSQQLLSGNYDCLSYLGQGKYKQVTLFIVGLLSQKSKSGNQICLRLMSSITKSFSNSDNRDSFLYICDVVRECGDSTQLKQAMCSTVVENFTWQKLTLWDCDLSECKEEMKIVCAVLRGNRPLELLNLMNNKIRDVTSLAQSVERNKTLRLLYLSDNPFNDVSPLTRSLKHNTKLTELQLDEKFQGESIVDELEKQSKHLAIYFWM